MKTFFFTLSTAVFLILVSFKPEVNTPVQDFQGQAYYFSKSKMELGSWGARMSEAQKKQVQNRLKNRLQKTYVLSFNKEASVFKEEDQADAIAGATDSWGNNFSRGDQYKNVKENALVQEQEFYGKKFLVKDKLQQIEWKMGSETKQIGQYMTFKATASIPTSELTWYDFSWSDIRSESATRDTIVGIKEEPKINMTEVEAWYTLQIPVSHGPAEYWGLPGLILEVSAGNTTILCSKVVLNSKEDLDINTSEKGTEITKSDYQATIQQKMIEMRDNRGRRRN